jgi:hypothetical protein
MAEIKDLKIRYTGDVSGVQRATSDIDKMNQTLSTKLAATGQKMVGVGKSMTVGLTAPLVAGGVMAVNSFMDANAVVHGVLQTWKKDADAGALSFEGMQTWSEKFGNSIGEDDEAVLQLSGKLQNAVDLTALFGKGGAQQGLQDMTQGVMDFSQATGKSTSLTTKLFQSIANDPKASLGTLVKLGVITKKQAAHYGVMADKGKGAAVSQELLAAMTDKYAGSAAKSATPAEKLKAQFDNMTESLGETLMPIARQVIGWLKDAMTWFQSLSPEVKDIAVKIAMVAAAIGPLLIILGKLMQAFSLVSKVMSVVASANPWVLIIAGVVLLVVLIIKNWSTIKAFLLKIWKIITNAWQAVWNKIKGVIMPVVKFIGGYIKTQIAVWGTIIRVLWGVVKTVFNGILTVAKTVWNAITTAIRAQWDIWRNVFNTVKGFIMDVWNTIKEKATGIWQAIGDTVTNIWDGIKNTVRDAVNFVIDRLNDIISGINTIINGANKLPGPDIPNIPEIPHMARGGMIRQAGLAWVGERGPELVNMPRGATVTPARGVGGTIIINVGGSVIAERDLADVVQRALLRKQRRGGTLGLA